MIADISNRLHSRTRAIEMLLCQAGIKPCARIAALDEKEFESICSDLGLKFTKSDFKVSLDFQGLYSTKGKIVQDGPGHRFYYVSLAQTICDAAKQAESADDARKLGEVLGYPKCCIDFFIDNRELQIKAENDYILPALRSTDERHFSFYLNVFARYFDFALVSHSPHSLDCEHSITMAREVHDWMMRHDKTLAEVYERFMTGVGIYLRDGIAYLPLATVDEGKMTYGKALSSPSNHPIVKLLDGRDVKISDNTITIPDGTIPFRDYASFA